MFLEPGLFLSAAEFWCGYKMFTIMSSDAISVLRAKAQLFIKSLMPTCLLWQTVFRKKCSVVGRVHLKIKNSYGKTEYWWNTIHNHSFILCGICSSFILVCEVAKRTMECCQRFHLWTRHRLHNVRRKPNKEPFYQNCLPLEVPIVQSCSSKHILPIDLKYETVACFILVLSKTEIWSVAQESEDGCR